MRDECPPGSLPDNREEPETYILVRWFTMYKNIERIIGTIVILPSLLERYLKTINDPETIEAIRIDPLYISSKQIDAREHARKSLQDIFNLRSHQEDQIKVLMSRLEGLV